MAIIIFTGSCGNARVCILLGRRRDLRRVPHYLLANLALTGFLSALIRMSTLTSMTTVNSFQIRNVPTVVEIQCKVGISLGPACVVLNALTLWLMALDRQDCVLRPFNRRLDTSDVKRIIPVTWILALITAVVFAVLMRNEPSVCVEFYIYNNSEVRGIFALVAAVGQLDNITMLVIIVTFVRIRKEFRSSAVNPQLGCAKSANLRREKKLTKLTIKLCGIFLLFRVPVKICIVMIMAKVGGFQGTAANTLKLLSSVIVDFTYVLNPFLYHTILKVQPPNQARQAVNVVNRIEGGARGNGEQP